MKIVPRSMRTEIVAFDRGGTFAPGEFRLAAPQPSKLLGKKSGGRSPHKKRGKHLRPPACPH